MAKALESLRGRVRVCNSFFGARKGAIESCIVEGLQKIVERTRLEGAQCVLIVSGDEDDGGWQLSAKQLEHIETIAFGHLYVEENEIRFLAANLGESLCSRTALGDDFDILITPQQDSKIGARGRLVVHDQRAYSGDAFVGHALLLEGH